MHACRLYSSSIVRRAAPPKGANSAGSSSTLQRCLGQPFDVEERLDQAVLSWLDHLADRRYIGRQHHAAGRHRIQERPRQHERGGQVDVQVTDPKDVGELLGQDRDRGR